MLTIRTEIQVLTMSKEQQEMMLYLVMEETIQFPEKAGTMSSMEAVATIL